jgi:hypothetical protein
VGVQLEGGLYTKITEMNHEFVPSNSEVDDTFFLLTSADHYISTQRCMFSLQLIPLPHLPTIPSSFSFSMLCIFHVGLEVFLLGVLGNITSIF